MKNTEGRHLLYRMELDTERDAQESGYDDIVKSCRETQRSLIKEEINDG